MKKTTTLITSILTTATALSGIILTSTFVSADDVVDEINITVPVSCSLSGVGMNSHNANIANGIYTADIGTTTLTAFCNDNEGFAIYAAGYTGDKIGGTNSNKLVGTTASGNATIESGLATSAGNPDVSNWAMKLAISQDSGDTTGTNAFTIDSAPNVALPSEAESGAIEAPFSSYHVVPNEYVKVAHKNSMTDMTTTTGGVKLTTTYAAYISKTQPADIYSGQVVYTLLHPASATPSIITPPTSCTTPVPGLTYMQDLTSSNKATILSNMTEDSQYYLADKRDDKTYCVAKLRDGNLWMTQNLDHDIVTDGSVTYDNTTTDLGWNGVSYSTASWTPASATKATSDTTWTTDETGATIPESYDPGELYWNGTAGSYNSESDCATAGGTWDSVNNRCNQISSTGNSHYHLGNYYNWTAAVAMNDSSNYSVDGIDANQSICPANWTLPKGDKLDQGPQTSPGSFQYLVERYGWGSSSHLMTDPTIWETAVKFILSGGYTWSSLASVGFNGVWWSSVVGNSAVAHALYINSLKYITPDYTTGRSIGNTIRCLAR
ncbi:hypothetical protein IKD98_02375 [Candidatus Saccharibacteria bacterium]|nr:hypothetical protein [Candidatus Saccharibacteria bacterium]